VATPRIVLATRKSPLALAQSELVSAHLRAQLGVETDLLKIVTTGDQQADWSLEQKGGKGLFTKELEHALLRGEADLAIHSAKDLPGGSASGLAVVGYLPRADPHDVLVLRVGLGAPRTIATGSPRRRLQIARVYPSVQFTEIRGNVDTRLRKIGRECVADATILAAAGLARLGISQADGVEFHSLGFETMVPAVGQGAIAIQCRAADLAKFCLIVDPVAALAVNLERALQDALGGGCHTALGAHATSDTLHFFHEDAGLRSFPLGPDDFAQPEATAAGMLKAMGLAARAGW
jgi:hydroxymethylbilane synthase